MIRRHQIRTMTALGLCAPLLIGIGVGGTALASAQRPEPTQAIRQGAQDTEATPTAESPTDFFTTGSEDFPDPSLTAVPADEVAESLFEYAADPTLSAEASCGSGLDLEQNGESATCTVIGWSGEEETYYAYIAPAGVSEDDYWLYFTKDAPLPAETAAVLHDGHNGTGAYPVFGEQDEQLDLLDPSLAVERANFVLDGFGREDLTVTQVDGQIDLRVAEPVRGTAIEEGSGRTVGVTLLPIPTRGEAAALMVSIDGP